MHPFGAEWVGSDAPANDALEVPAATASSWSLGTRQTGTPPLGLQLGASRSVMSAIGPRPVPQAARWIRFGDWTKPFWGTHETALKQSGR